MRQVRTAYLALGTPVEDAGGWAVRHNDVDVVRDRVRGDGFGGLSKLMGRVEVIFVVCVGEMLSRGMRGCKETHEL